MSDLRIGIIALLHESNTFAVQPTTIEQFAADTLLEGDAIRTAMAAAHHEVGGFFAGLESGSRERAVSVQAVPVFAARALPSGTICAAAFDELLDRMFTALGRCGSLDAVLVAPHGATVSEQQPDADGYWLSELRSRVGPDVPIVGTLDAHANLSEKMVRNTDALVAYRTNPHLDQRARGAQAATLLVRMLTENLQPVMRAVSPPLAINIERQMTTEPHLTPLYALADRQLEQPGVLTNSILLGFPYSDVSEMGSAALVVTDDDDQLAMDCVNELGEWMWTHRAALVGEFIDAETALNQATKLEGRVCLLDMGDNVGGGSAADGTVISEVLHRRQVPDAFVCLCDPVAVRDATHAGVGRCLELSMGGKTDNLHGSPLQAEVTVRSVHDGRFHEPNPRHGGITDFDQGPTAVVQTQHGLTIMLTSHRMVPFSLEQLRACGVDPAAFRFLVAKGVNAPVAAYAEVCEHFIRVDTPGSTCADMTQLSFHHRRQPMFPFEPNTPWSP